MLRTLLVTLIVILTGCHGKPKPAELPPVEVSVFPVTPMTVPAVFEFIGQTQSSHLVEIRARVEGYLNTIGYTEGELVNQDDLLFQLDPAQFVASVERARGMLEEQKALLWKAERDAERMEPLYAKNAASRKDLDDALSSVMAKKAAVIQAKAQLDEAELNLGYAKITSPIKGLSGRSRFREGALITPGPEGLLTNVAVLDPIWVIFNVSDNEILQNESERQKKFLVYPKDMNFDVKLLLADGSSFPQLGKVNFAQPWLDPKTGTMEVRAQFSNPNSSLKPGQFVRVSVYGAERPGALFVPQAAVMQGQKGKFVYIVKADGTAEMRPVNVGEWLESYWLIYDGLIAGEKVITNGVAKVQPGQPVKIIKEEPLPTFQKTNEAKKLTKRPASRWLILLSSDGLA